MPSERLQKLLARAGVASRRLAEDIVSAGRVRVDGRVARLGDSADPAIQRIEVDGRPLPDAAGSMHYAVHKPRGLLSSSRDERGRRSVTALVPRTSGTRLWPAGRLDVDSEGLMLLTNDGDWANRVLHPRHGLAREYAVLADSPPSAATLRALRSGVELEDGPARLFSARIALPPTEVEREAREAGIWLRVRIGEGRKREVRRIFDAVGHRTLRLVRTRLGPLSLDGLRVGEHRLLEPAEAAELAGLGRRAPRPGGRAYLSVAIDGPSGAGKSTVGHALAVRIGATFVDTGLMYRALTLAALDREIDTDDGAALGALAREVRIEVRKRRSTQSDRLENVLLDGRDVTRAVRTPRVDGTVSAVSRHAAVREAMLGVQRAAAKHHDTVMVGRDIGTVVLPNASLKVYLTATAPVRAARRAAEMGQPERAEEYLVEILRRDALDSGRELAPLRQAAGAIVLDTGELDVDACVAAIIEHLPARDPR
ncbi:MAG: (d)CMP kinase [Candidatus Limnocylindria bacterium]